MRALVAIGFVCVTAHALAGDAQPEQLRLDDASERTAVIDELSKRSRLESSELNRLLADCNVNQQSMYFCAWRDQIASDRGLARVVADKQKRTPRCAESFKAKLANWERSRNQSCEKSSRKEWGDGSMQPIAQVICVTEETLRMTKRFECMSGCRFQ